MTLQIRAITIIVSIEAYLVMNDMNSFSKYQLELEKFLLSRGEHKYTHEVLLNVKYEGKGIQPLTFPDARVLFDFNDNDSNRVFVRELAHAPNEYYEDFRPLFQSFEFDSQQDCLIIKGSGTYGPYKVTLF